MSVLILFFAEQVDTDVPECGCTRASHVRMRLYTRSPSALLHHPEKADVPWVTQLASSRGWGIFPLAYWRVSQLAVTEAMDTLDKKDQQDSSVNAHAQ
jgi:hypothetical protein